MISIIKKPQEYTPANNPCRWQLKSDNDNIVAFKVELLEATTNSTISIREYFVTPDYPKGTYFDLSKTLSDYVKWQIDNDTTLVKPITKSFMSYKLRLTERIYDSTLNTVIDGDKYFSSYIINDSCTPINITTNKVDNGDGTETYTVSFLSSTNVDITALTLSYKLKSDTVWHNSTGGINSPRTLTLPVGEYDFKFRSHASGSSCDLAETFVFDESIVLADGLTENFYVWDANLDRIAFNKYSQNDYIITPSHAGKFLSNKPNHVKVNSASSEMLYFIHNGMTDMAVNIMAYDFNNALIIDTTYSISNLSSSKMFRVHVSPKHLATNLLIDFSNVKFYTVKLCFIDFGSPAKTDTRTYHYEKIPCNLDLINMLWFNPLGGFDSYQFINPQYSLTTNKTSIVKKYNKLDENENYSDYKGLAYNPNEEIIDKHSLTTIQICTKELSDSESKWLQELVKSKQVFIEINGGVIIPVILKTDNYQIQLNKYLGTGINQQTFELSLPENISPIYDDESINVNIELVFDSYIIFDTINSTYENGLTATILSTADTIKFEYNLINGFLGTPMTMEIEDSGNLIMVIDFVSDYLDKPCRITRDDGSKVLTTFQNGIINI